MERRGRGTYETGVSEVSELYHQVVSGVAPVSAEHGQQDSGGTGTYNHVLPVKLNCVGHCC